MAIQKKLTDYIEQEVFDSIYVSARTNSRAKDKLKPFVTLAFANALAKGDLITQVVMSRLQTEDETAQAAALRTAGDDQEVRKVSNLLCARLTAAVVIREMRIANEQSTDGLIYALVEDCLA